MKGLDLKTVIIEEFRQKDFKMYERIIQFKRMSKIDEILEERYSISFLLDVFFAFENDLVNIPAVLDEIKYLEGLGSKTHTKPPSQFNRRLLKGLWHKHYSDGNIRELAENVKNAMRNYGIPYLDEKFQEAESDGKTQYITKEDVPTIVDDLVSGNLARRRAEHRMTGEWIVYASYKDQYYYLCLANHNDDDSVIREKIDSTASHEFPFLKETLSKK